MRHVTRNTKSSGCSGRAVAALLLCAFLALLLSGSAPASAQEYGMDGAPMHENAALAAGEAGAGELGAQAEGDLIASGEIGTCVWQIDANGKLTISPANGDTGTINFDSPDESVSNTSEIGRPPWYPYHGSIASAEVKSTVIVTGGYCKMFKSCVGLTEVDLSGLDISRVSLLHDMFGCCSNLTHVDMSMLKAPSATSISWMFVGCSRLKDVKLPDFTGAKIQSMFSTFAGCTSLVKADLSTIDTSETLSASWLFGSCTSLQTVLVSESWDLTQKASGSYVLFRDCYCLVGANGTSYAEVGVDDASYARIDMPGAPGYFCLAGDQDAPIASGELGTCTWIIDADGNLTISPAEGDRGTIDFSNPADPGGLPSEDDDRAPWYPYASKIRSAKVVGTVVIDGPSGRCRMFEGCSTLVKVDLSGLDVSHATDLGSMFCGCRLLRSVDLSMLDASSVTSTVAMFKGCTMLRDIKLPDFTCSKPERLSEMFSQCKSLGELDLSSMDTSCALDMTEMFKNCNRLQKVTVGEKWDVSERLNSGATGEGFLRMFSNCDVLVGPNGTAYAGSGVEDGLYARVDSPGEPGYFWLAGNGESSIAAGKLGACIWVVDANGKLTLSPLKGDVGELCIDDAENPQWHTSIGTFPPWYPYGQKIVSFEVEGTVALTGNVGSMFNGCAYLRTADLSGLDTSKLTCFDSMFIGCSKLKYVDASMLDASSATSSAWMFSNCDALVDVRIPDFNGAKLSNISGMFQSCSSLVSLDLSTIDTANVKAAQNLFVGCRSLEKVLVGTAWDLPAQINDGNKNAFIEAFGGCFALKGANGTSYADAGVADGSYARVDMPDSPGYFWLAESAGEGDGQDGDDQGGGPGEGGGSEGSGSGGGQGEGSGGEDGSQQGNGQQGGGQSGESDGAGDSDSSSDGAPGFGGDGSGNGTRNGSDNGGNASGSGKTDGGSAASKLAGGAAGTQATSTAGNVAASTASTASAKSASAPSGASASGKARRQAKRTSIAKASVKLSKSKFAYDGKTKKPAVAVKLGGKTLKRGRDYTVSYSKGRTKVGTYKVVVVGKGAYKAKVTKRFTIVAKPKPKPKPKRASIAKAKVGLSMSKFVYDGRAKKPGVTVRLGKKTLKRGRDYTVSYSKGCKKVGAYKVAIFGKGAYKSKVTKRFTIVAKPKPKRASIAKALVGLSAGTFAYDGKAKKPAVAVRLGGKTLKRGRDYTVSYSKGRTKVGTYKVAVTGRGAYRSKAAKNFVVVPAAPKLKSVKSHKNSDESSGFVVSWKGAGPASVGYEVRWSPSPSFGKSASFAFAGDAPFAKQGAVALRVRTAAWLGRAVYVQMRAVKAVGGKTYRSGWSAAKRVKLKK